MCDLKDAHREEKLGQLCEKEESEKAVEHYLEAASIYTLNAELQKNDSMLINANSCYRKASQLRGMMMNQILSKEELARRTLIELDQIRAKKPKINPLEELKKLL